MLSLLTLLGCGLSEVLPGDPVLSPAERAAFDVPTPAAVQYDGPPRVEFPVLPVQVFGLRYSLDLVLVTTHPDWDMHEYARLDLPTGSVWLAKDADRNKVQQIVADLPEIDSWVPEIPVTRYSRPVTVIDNSTATHADLVIRYQNPHDQQVEVHYQGRLPTKPSPKRNGNTMGHSRDMAAVALDLHLYRAGGKAEVSIDGEKQKIKKLLGIYPMKFLLAQTQGGFAIASSYLSAAPGGFTLVRPYETKLPTQSTEQWSVADGWARTDNPVTSLRYHYTNGELDRAQVWQVGVEWPVTEAVFQPALPDLRRPFKGVVESRFALDIAGQQGHATGVVRCQWIDADHVTVDLIPEAPRWIADRPMRAHLYFDAEGVALTIVRV